MTPAEIGRAYDRIASWWSQQLHLSTRGLPYIERAIGLCSKTRRALDVGCGSGGRILNALVRAGFEVTGLDVSEAMLRMAREHHPAVNFLRADICRWRPPAAYDLITAWDSFIHLPHRMQKPVTRKLCGALAPNGVILLTAGGTDGEVTGTMNGESFYHSSLDETEYLDVMRRAGCRCVLLDRDQLPQEHVVIIGVKERLKA